MDRKKKLQGIVMLLTVTMIWGSGFIATEYAIRSEMPTAWIMAIRFCVGALLIGACFFRRIFPALFSLPVFTHRPQAKAAQLYPMRPS